ncbi:ATP-binding protein [Streptomyces sp. ADMS]|uniref:ATP-binding protein n=1 Tax=Streptomyces sp. ADMS TaxID=3071415 RepID=UPI00296F77DD|nr:ATP-binding protein [Streptomyces sp. ADMS]MDW4903842.1 ATP-binding protein [Streptomyces sp. ADMS]
MPDPQPPTAPLYEDRLDYTPVARSVPLARHRTARLVVEWGHPKLAGDAALVVSELMTNALLHGSIRGRLIRVRLTVTTSLRVEVSDPRAERMPCPREVADDDQFGRGLLLVGALAGQWGVGPREGVGKTVWAEWGLVVTPCDAGPLIGVEK